MRQVSSDNRRPVHLPMATDNPKLQGIRRYARRSSSLQIMAAWRIAEVLHANGKQPSEVSRLLLDLGKEGLIIGTPVLRIARLFKELIEKGHLSLKSALEKGFYHWDNLARAARVHADRDAFIRELEASDFDGATLLEKPLIKRMSGADIPRLLRCLRRLEGQTVASTQSDGFNVVIKSIEGMQFIIYTTRRVPIQIQVLPDDSDATA